MSGDYRIPTETEKAQMLEKAIKALESSESFYLVVLSNKGIREFRNFKPSGNTGMTFLRVIANLTEDCWKAIDKQTGRKKDHVQA